MLVCPNRYFALYLLAYVLEHRNESKFEIFLSNHEKVPPQLEALAKECDVQIIDEIQLRKNSYREVFIHSYDRLADSDNFLSKIEFESIVLYADGMNNGFYGLPRIDNRVSKLVYFGFQLEESSFNSLKSSNTADFTSEVVSWNSIKEIWNRVVNISGQTHLPEFRDGDFVLAMRYWGSSSDHYEFSSDASILEYLKVDLANIKGIKRVIYRPHPRNAIEIEVEVLKNIFGPGVEIVNWNDVYPLDDGFPERCGPESIFWNCRVAPTGFFGFDSTLCILVGIEHPSTEIIWPKRETYKSFFKREMSNEIVDEKVRWMQELISKSLEKGEKTQRVFSSGTAIERAITILLLDSWREIVNHERLQQSQERDALTQERDALTQERDALTQERDAVVNSTIWRSTQFLRAIISKIKAI